MCVWVHLLPEIYVHKSLRLSHSELFNVFCVFFQKNKQSMSVDKCVSSFLPFHFFVWSQFCIKPSSLNQLSMGIELSMIE